MDILHIAKANLRKNRSHTLSSFIIILLVVMLSTTGLSIFADVNDNYAHNLNRLNSSHSMFVMTADMYKDDFEDLVASDARVSEYNIQDTVYMERSTFDYGGTVDVNGLFYNLDTPQPISMPLMVEQDTTISHDTAIYLPYYAKFVGYNLGDDFPILYKNKPLTYTVAGFFESNEHSTTSGHAVKYYLHDEAFQSLLGQVGRSVSILVRFHDRSDSLPFNRMFADSIDVELSAMGEGSFSIDAVSLASATTLSTMTLSSIVMGFALLIAIVALMVIRFRVVNSIEDNLHAIGVLKAGGFTSAQIIKSLVLEYALVSVPAALLGIFAAMPLFSPIRTALTSMSGVNWTLGVNVGVGVLCAICIIALLLAMVLFSSRKIKKLPPVVALRGGTESHSFRRNFFPLSKGFGGIQLRLGLKNIFSYGKLYGMIGIILAGFSLAITFMAVMYQNFALDTNAIVQMSGVEIADVTLAVTPHTDADALALEMEDMDEVRKTSMLDWVTMKVDGEAVAGFLSDDYSLLETMHTHAGKFPAWDNEIAMSASLASHLGKTIGDAVLVKANGVTQEFIICGFYTTTNNGGMVSAITLDGFRRINPNQERGGINVYLTPGVTVEEFSTALQTQFGVVNMYQVDENDPHAAAKQRAEEKITNYLQQYQIESVDYAVMYRGELIASGSSRAYQIEKLTNYRELIDSQIGLFAGVIGLAAQFIAIISLIILALILSITIKSMLKKRRRELGTLKAGGFTTRQLMLQLGISFLPSAILGTIAGCVSGGLLVNVAFGAVFQSMGVARSTLTISPIIITVLGCCIIATTFVIATLSSIKIRTISAYELLSE